MDVRNDLILLKQTRRNIISVVEDVPHQDLCRIPAGFNNNIFWNVGHIYVTQQLLTRGLSGVDLEIDDDIRDAFRKGTNAHTDYEPEIWLKLKDDLMPSIDRLEQDLEGEALKLTAPYATSFGVKLSSIEDSVRFVAIHEALHLGYIMAQRRALQIT